MHLDPPVPARITATSGPSVLHMLSTSYSPPPCPRGALGWCYGPRILLIVEIAVMKLLVGQWLHRLKSTDIALRINHRWTNVGIVVPGQMGTLLVISRHVCWRGEDEALGFVK